MNPLEQAAFQAPTFLRAIAVSLVAHFLLVGFALGFGAPWQRKYTPPPNVKVYLPGKPDPDKKPGLELAEPKKEAPAKLKKPPKPKPKPKQKPKPKPKPKPKAKAPQPKPKTDAVKSLTFDDLLKQYGKEEEEVQEEKPTPQPEAKAEWSNPSPGPPPSVAGEGATDLNHDQLAIYYRIIEKNVVNIWKIPPELISEGALRGEVRIWIDVEGKITRKLFHKRSGNAYFDNTIEMAVERLQLPPIWFDLKGQQYMEANLIFSPEIFH